MSNAQPTPSRPRSVAFFAAMFAATTIAALAIAELALRALAPAGITYHSYNYDPITGGTLHPNSKVIYRDMDGRVIRRDVNTMGYLDIEREQRKPAGTYRIGFFGDSYTEARQVELEETFFRLVEHEMNTRLEAGDRLADDDGTVARIETLAFGIAGRSAVQSMLDCRRRVDTYDLDCVIYVMFDNDPRDQMATVRRENNFPFATIDRDTFALDYSPREFFAVRDTRARRAWQTIMSRSLVLSTIDRRLKLLRQYGLSPQTTRDRAPAIHPNTAPSTWQSQALLEEAQTIHGRVIRAWRDEVELGGRIFLVAYIPWEHALRDPLESQDSWLPWLHQLAAEHAIRLVDPTGEFLARLSAGETPFGDHLTPVGHEALARAVTDHLLQP